MPNYLVTDTELTNVADAIREKGGTSSQLEWPDGYTDAIGAISGGGGGASGSMSDPIRFFDYDGTLVASYKSVPSALPDNPSHEGLVSQGWNYTLAQIQSQFAASGSCDVGQMYITESGDTEIDVSMTEGRLAPLLNLAPNGTVVVDWGDGSSKSTMTGTSLTTRKSVQHIYAAAGNYTIKLHVSSGSVALYSTSVYSLLYKNTTQLANRVYTNCVRAVRIGDSITIGAYAFGNCYSLQSITIPSNVTSIGNYAFADCYSLHSVTIPNGVTSIGTYTFNNCYSLNLVAIPSNVTSIGGYSFYCCYSLQSVTIPTNVTSFGNYTFSSCYTLESVIISNSVTSVGTNMFQNCYCLSSFTIPSSVTSIGNYAFQGCRTLHSVTIPSNVASIGTYAFQTCYGLSEIHFLPTTPPTVSNSNAWTNIQSDCIIYVPSGTLSAYTSASNYPSSSTYTYVEE